TAAGEILVEEEFDLQGINQGTFQQEVFQLLIDRGTAVTYRDETLYLALANLADGGTDARNARVVLDQMVLAIQEFQSADYNYDGKVDLADRAVWTNSFGSTTSLDADGNLDGVVNGADLLLWQQSRTEQANTTSAVPEPGASFMVFSLTMLHSIGTVRLR
ncbi:MAG: hypothetical protein RID07_15335, partial [Lacipirellulaceae bacterium]